MLSTLSQKGFLFFVLFASSYFCLFLILDGICQYSNNIAKKVEIVFFCACNHNWKNVSVLQIVPRESTLGFSS